MATKSSTLAWKITWTEEPGRLQSMGSRRVGHNWAASLSRIGEGNGNPLQYSCWRIPGTVEPGRLLSMGSHRVGHDWCDLAAAAAAAAASVNRKSPLLLHDNSSLHVTQPTLQKLNELDYEVLAHQPYSRDLLPTDYHFFKHLDNFCRENTSTTNRIQKMLSKRLSNPKAQIFTTGINKFISHWQKCIDYNDTYFN